MTVAHKESFKYPSEKFYENYMDDHIKFTNDVKLDLLANMINELGLKIEKLESLIKEQSK